MANRFTRYWFRPKKEIDRLRFSTKCWHKGILDGIDADDMPFLSHYVEVKVLNGLGYRQDLNDLDAYTGTCLINIKAELNKLESEDMKNSSKKGSRRG